MDQSQHSRNNTNTAQDSHNLNASTDEAPHKAKTQHRICGHPLYARHSRRFQKICGKYGIQAYFKGNTTIKHVLMKPKDQDHKDKKSGVIYSYQCEDIACGEEYIGETARTLGEDTRSNLKQPSPFHAHIQQTGYTTTSNNFNIIGREDQGLARTIKESIYIRVNNPILNRNIGKYNLNHIWDKVLFNTPWLKIRLFPKLITHTQ